MHLACFGVRVLSQICCIAAAASDFAVAERVFLQACLWLFQPPLLPLKKKINICCTLKKGVLFSSGSNLVVKQFATVIRSILFTTYY